MLRSNAINPDPRLEKEARALLNSGHNVIILGWDRLGERNFKEFVNIGNFQVEGYFAQFRATFGGGFLKNLKSLILFQIWLIFRLIKLRNKFDVIHAADFDTILPSVLVKLLFGKKVVYDIYDFYVEAFSVPKSIVPIIKAIDYYCIKKSDCVILATEERIKQISGSSPKNIIIIHNTPEKIKFEQRDLFNRKNKIKTVISYVGILQEHRFLKEISDVVIGSDNLEFHVAGFGQLSDYFKELSSRNSKIKFFGKVDYDKSLSINSNSDVMVAVYDPKIPNHKFSAPNKLYESLMLGKPIIVCKDTGIDSIVEENKIGFSIYYNHESLKDAFIRLEQLDYKSEVFILKLQEIYKVKYSWQLMSQRLNTLYENL